MTNARSTAPEPLNEPVLSYAPGTPEKTEIKAAMKELKSSVRDIQLNINGKPGLGKETFEVTSPQDHKKVLARVQSATKEDVRNAINGALESRKAWAALPWEDRAAVFLKAADLLATKYRPYINGATILGQGKSVYQAEVDAACELIDFLRFNVKFAEEIYSWQPQSSRGMWNRSEVRGLEGFILAVTPFNFTAIAVNLPTAPAIMGCSVVWKPAHTTMLACDIAMAVLREAGLPDGVINMVAGDAQMIGGTALEHPELSGIHFTGSTGTFNHFWKEVGKNIDTYKYYPRIVGETGGKDFVFALPSTDPDPLVTALVRGAFEYQGQKCSAASRAYIAKSVWAKMRDNLVEQTKGLKMGDPEDFTNFIGPVIDERSFDKIVGYIDQAKSDKDAEIIAGGEYDKSKGYFIRPTIIEASRPDYRTMKEEIFGPILTIYVYEDDKIDETLEICDKGTDYALTGAIFGRERHEIKHAADRLINAAGNFYINDKPTGSVVGQQPFGGGRASGTNDKAGSKINLLRWSSMRSIKENFIPVTDYSYPFMGES